MVSRFGFYNNCYIYFILRSRFLDRRVVITGMGVISPLGIGLKDYYDGLSKGRSGIKKLDIDPKKYKCRIAGLVPNWEPSRFISKQDSRRMDRAMEFALGAASLAYEDAGLNNNNFNNNTAGVIIGACMGGMRIYEENVLMFSKIKKVSPFFLPMEIPDMMPGKVAIKYKLRGPNFAIISACATSNHAIGTAADLIRLGRADIMIAGGAEAATTPLGLQGYTIIKALSLRNDEPEKASRPFDRDRDGFVMGEGAGIIVLEELEHAKKRGAFIHAELIGYGMSSDAYEMVAPRPDGSSVALAIQRCLADAKINPEDVEYINMHATSTPQGDIAEVNAIKIAFKEHTKKLMISSTKSMVGHLLGAAGGVELIATVLGMENSVIFPTTNLDNQDSEIDLDCVPNYVREKAIKIALSNSFGFGGHNSILALKKWE